MNLSSPKLNQIYFICVNNYHKVEFSVTINYLIASFEMVASINTLKNLSIFMY